MKEVKRLFISLSATVILLFVGVIYQRESRYSFTDAVKIFSFNYFEFETTLAILFIISIVFPIIAMIILFNRIYEAPGLRHKFISKVIMKHIFFGYILMCIIFMVDIIYDGTFATYEPDKASDYNEWHKYILHFIVTPILFLDAVYSLEVEKIRSSDEKTLKKYDKLHYYTAQVFFSLYIVYIFFVILFIYKKHDAFMGVLITPLADLRATTEIFNHIQYLVTDMMFCIFAALQMGLVDQNVSLRRIIMVFKFYTGWTIEKVNDYLPRFGEED